MLTRARVLLVVLLVAALGPAARAQEAQAELQAPLPVDPAVRMTELPNGMGLWLRKHDTPPDRVGVWLHVDSGSLNETDEQRGLAHFLEHMAFNGSEHFPPGELVEFFESLGLTFGTHQNAFTSFDQTTYILALPETNRNMVDKGLLCLSDFAFRLLLTDEEIRKERDVVLEEIRARKGPRQRIIEKLLPVILPGSRVAERLPIGKEEVIANVKPEQVRSYYRTWYRPGLSTLLVVGDADMEMVEKVVGEHFTPWSPVQDPPEEADPGVRPYEKLRTGVVTDPEQTETEVSVVSVRPLEDFETVGDFRRRLVDQLGNWMVNRRLRELVQKGEAPFQEASVEKYPFLNTCTYIDAAATGQPDRWRPMMRSVLSELKRAREHGFLQQEFRNARKAILAAAEQAARTEPTRDARSFLNEMDSALARGRKPMSAAQELDLIRKLIDGISLVEATDAFRRNFDSEARLLLVIMPEKEGLPVPAKEDLLNLAKKMEQTEVSPPKEKEIRESLLREEPTAGAVSERTEDEETGILSVIFENGVRAHLRSMDFKKDQVFIRLILAGGIIEETPGNRGVTGLAAEILNQPAGGGLTSTQIEDIMTGKNVDLGGGFTRDTVTISVNSATRDIEDAFRLLHLVLTRPRLERSAVDRWKDQLQQTIEQRRVDVRDQAMEKMDELLSGGDPRFEFPTKDQIASLTREQAQAWFERLIRESPVELAVVGDMERERALELTRKYLGSLNQRSFHDPELEGLRRLSYPEGGQSATAAVPTITPTAVVLSGWRGADWTEVEDRRVLQLAAQILTSRLRESIREAKGLTYSIWCVSQPAKSFPGAGLFSTIFTTDPQEAAEVAEEVRGEVQKFASEGPTEKELATVHRQFRNRIEKQQKEPGYWVNVLSDMRYHGTRLQDVKQALEKYTSYTREDLMEVVGRHVTDQRRVQVIALPEKEEQPE